MSQPPLSEFAQRIEDGGVRNVRRELLEAELTDVRCSDAQLIAFMERHNMPHTYTLEAPEVRKTGLGTYTRILFFCIRSQSLLQRLLHGKCAGVVDIHLMVDRITYVIAHGAK
ncbi:MAG: hypothetical protein AAF293_00180 [Pseudomonadota bacterium]